jgi:hypothetical protein
MISMFFLLFIHLLIMSRLRHRLKSKTYAKGKDILKADMPSAKKTEKYVADRQGARQGMTLCPFVCQSATLYGLLLSTVPIYNNV